MQTHQASLVRETAMKDFNRLTLKLLGSMIFANEAIDHMKRMDNAVNSVNALAILNNENSPVFSLPDVDLDRVHVLLKKSLANAILAREITEQSFPLAEAVIEAALSKI